MHSVMVKRHEFNIDVFAKWLAWNLRESIINTVVIGVDHVAHNLSFIMSWPLDDDYSQRFPLKQVTFSKDYVVFEVLFKNVWNWS